SDLANQPLGQDAVQRRYKVVSFHAHVEESSEHIQNVIGVDRGEDQVAGQRGVDGDLGGFLVADFAHHDFVGVMTQDGPKTAGEGETLLFVYRDLGDALDLVLHRVFDGDDLVFVVLDLTEGGVQRSGFSGAGGTGDQNHA